MRTPDSLITGSLDWSAGADWSTLLFSSRFGSSERFPESLILSFTFYVLFIIISILQIGKMRPRDLWLLKVTQLVNCRAEIQIWVHPLPQSSLSTRQVIPRLEEFKVRFLNKKLPELAEIGIEKGHTGGRRCRLV